ncbi:MAG: CRTAC1 family protein [Armatimonadetes bacterium]|nr:CRTAC1 family protein [Armatimonadota bacterium]
MAKVKDSRAGKHRIAGWTSSIMTTAISIMVIAAGLFVARPALLGSKAPASPPAVTADLPSSILAHFNANIERPALRAANEMEAAVDRVTADVVQPWKDGWTSKNGASLASVLTPTATVSDLSAPLGSPSRSFAGIAQHKWAGVSNVDAAAAASMADKYLGQFKQVEDLGLEIDSAKVQGNTADLSVSYDLRGIDNAGQHRQDRGRMNIVCVSEGGKWKISKMAANGMESLTCAKPAFADVTQNVGLNRVNVFQRLEAIRRGGYAIALGDYDGDKNVDLFVGAWGASQLFRNNGDGTYTDVTAQAGLSDITLVKAAAFVDVRNTGTKDLVLSRFTMDQDNDVQVYTNENGRFTKVDNSLTRNNRFDKAMPMALADFNKDGYLDLYVGFPGNRDFTVTDRTPQKLTAQGMFINNHSGKFVDNTAKSGLQGRLAATLPTFPHASVAADFDGDGQMDLLVVDDRRNRSPIYRNMGNARFVDVGKNVGINNMGWGMGVAVGDYDNDGKADIYVTNVDFTAARRVAAVVKADPKQVLTGNHLYRNLGNGRFEDVTDKAGVGWAGQGSGGCAWVDYDNDGNQDLYVVNGLWSGASKKDFASTFVRNYVAAMQEPTQMQASVAASDANVPSPKDPDTTNLVMKFLASYRGADGKEQPISMGGYQRHCLFRNNGDGTFTEVGYMTGVDRLEDGYMPAIADYNKDGKVDLFLRNADPGVKEHWYSSLNLLQNNTDTSNQSLTVYLKGDGKKTNRDAVGTIVTIWTGGKKQVREVIALNGASQSEMGAFFGLGKSGKVDRMQVRWPSGKVQEFANLTPGRITIEEGAKKISSI